jgi:hypothetical protein
MEGPLNIKDIENEKNITHKRKFWLKASGVVALVLLGIAIIVVVGVWFLNRLPGIGVPINRGGWEVTITDVHLESRLNGVGGVFTPNLEGMKFFVVDYSVDYKGSLGQSKFTLYGTATTEKGETLPPDIFGFGFGDSLIYGGVEEGKAFTLKPENVEKSPMKASLVFIIPEENASQTYKIQFLDLPKATFLVKVKP